MKVPKYCFSGHFCVFLYKIRLSNKYLDVIINERIYDTSLSWRAKTVSPKGGELTMKSYEVLYIIKADTADEAKETIVEKFSNLVQSNGGTVDTVDKWGMKKFAYPINYMNEGYYVLMAFTAEETVPAEMSRQMRITDEVIRHMITCR